MATDALLKLVVISLFIGIIFGIVFLLLLKLRRRNTVVDSLVDTQKFIGLTGIVEIPFDQNSKGKIRVNFQGSIIFLTAISHSTDQLKLGEKVLIIELEGNKASVIPENYSRNFNN
ncbi:MAG: NfeD family protein [Cyanobacteria bacterium P01_G01_bin.49]